MPDDRPIHVELEPLVAEDFPTIRSWMDPDIFPVFRAPVDDDQLQRLLTKREDGKLTSVGYRIVWSGEPRFAGLVHAVIDGRSDLAHIGQIVIGDPRLRGRGLGTAALKLILAICFEDLALHRAQLFVDETNAAAIACYKKCGFVTEGLMRENARLKGTYINTYCMSMLDREWRGVEA